MSGLSHHASKIVAVVAIAGLFGFARLPEPSDSELDRLAERFAFTRLEMPQLGGVPHRRARDVHPTLERIRGWISAVGAGVALADVDGDGLPNDVCHVEPRTDQVVVAPVEPRADGFAPFELLPSDVEHDPDTMAPMGCLPGDFDEDGRTDLLVYYWGRPPVVFLDRGATGSALERDRYVDVAIAPASERWYTNALARADVDGDGRVDLVVGNYFPDGARILDADGPGSEHMHSSMSRAYNGGRLRLLLHDGLDGDGRVRFTALEGVFDDWVETGWTLALGAADLDGDLLPEIYVANDFGPDHLFHNRSSAGRVELVRVTGERRWSTPRSKVLGKDSFKGMGVDFGDVDGDGRLDIFVSNIADEYALEESHFLFLSTGDPAMLGDGRAPYTDASEPLGVARSGWGWESRLADFDNDGALEAFQATGFMKGDTDRWPELHEVATANDGLLSNPSSWPSLQPGDDLSGHEHNPFYVRGDDGRFHDVAPRVGLGAEVVTRGIATADVDGDGDLDLAVANQWEPSSLYRNDAAGAGGALVLRLRRALDAAPLSVRAGAQVLPRSTDAIGAVARVTLPDGRQLTSQVDGGNGHSGKRSPELHFGLGAVADGALLPVELSWRDRDGRRRTHTLHLDPGWHTVLLGDRPSSADHGSQG